MKFLSLAIKQDCKVSELTEAIVRKFDNWRNNYKDIQNWEI